MLKQTKFFVFIIFNFFCAMSCRIISFEELSIFCSIEEESYYDDKNNVYLEFSIEPIKEDIEKKLLLKSDNQVVPLTFSWNEQKVYLKPENKWIKGQKYQIYLNGPLYMADGRTYSKSFKRNFYFGLKDGELSVIEYSPNNNDTVVATTPISITFNKAIDTITFLEEFSVSPSCKLVTIFSDDKKSVEVMPADKWENNTIYNWSFSDVLSEDEYKQINPVDYFFYTKKITDYPYIEQICPVLKSGESLTWLLSNQLETLIDDQPIGFVFSNEMDFKSIEAGIVFKPTIKGYLQCDGDNKNRYLFIPQMPYDSNMKYTIQLDKSICDIDGISLYETNYKVFTTANQYFHVSEILLNSDNTSFTQEANDYLDFSIPVTNQIETKIVFDTVIEESSKNDIIEKVQFSLLFPSSGANPIIKSISWDLNSTSLIILWENFTVSTPNISFYYRLLITGGKYGIENGRGEIMENDVCLTIRSMK